MPKLKTNRGAAKRFSLTGSGKVKRSKAFASHILTSKTKKRKRNLRKSAILDHVDEKGVKRLIPYL
ncbi:MAG: 50S ribosomal protein L35 [Deltaproteobacteria bacterium]|nr:50S ribosomal protein L35 [Deltaproteobacteria bacterium]